VVLSACHNGTERPFSDEAPPVIVAPEQIVYTTLAPLAWDLYSWDSSGSTPKRIAPDPALDYDATFSPNGTWLVFTSERRGNADLWAIDLSADSPPILLTPSETMQDAATFSPDGRWLAFVDTREGNADIYLMPFRADDPAAAFAQAVNLTRNPGGDFRPAFSPDGHSIAFSSDRDRSLALMLQADARGDDLWSRAGEQAPGRVGSEIYVMRADGSNPRRLTDANGWDGSPAWSQDGGTLFFYSERDGVPRIWRMNLDGSAQTAITPAGVPALSPAVMVDGRVAYSYSEGPGYLPKLWRIGSVVKDGFDAHPETPPDLDCRGAAFQPGTGRLVCYGRPPGEEDSSRYLESSLLRAVGQHSRVQLPDRTLDVRGLSRHFLAVSPDGSKIAAMKLVSSNEEGGSHLIIGLAESGHERELFRPQEPNFQFGLSWAGDWVVFTSGFPFGPEAAPVDVWKVRSDGSGAVNLTAGSPANDAWPDFSRDGRRIVFRSGRDGNFEIYLMDADGGNVRRLTDNPARETMPALSPQGDRVAFTSNRDGDYEIYRLDLEENGEPRVLTRLTRSPGYDMHVRYSPDGKWVVFTSSRSGFNDELFLSFTEAGQTYGEIHALRLADGFLVRLTHNKWEDGPVAWGVSSPTSGSGR